MKISPLISSHFINITMKFSLQVNEHTTYILTMFSTSVLYFHPCNAVGLVDWNKEENMTCDFDIYIFQWNVSTCILVQNLRLFGKLK